MQDRYVGDIGDYIKLALLRVLAPGRKLGIAWYRTEALATGRDGRHVAYLEGELAAHWDELDRDLHATLKTIREGPRPSLASLEAGLLPGDTKFHRKDVATGADRSAWFASLNNWFADRDLIFADPDNGIEPDQFDPASSRAIKSITYAEIRRLRFPSRALIVYHHQTRRKGGHQQEITYIGEQLRQLNVGCVAAIRARPWSPRVFFLVGFDQVLWGRAKAFAQAWPSWLEWNELTGPPDALGLPPHDPYSIWAEERLDAFANNLRNSAYFDSLFGARPGT